MDKSLPADAGALGGIPGSGRSTCFGATKLQGRPNGAESEEELKSLLMKVKEE